MSITASADSMVMEAVDAGVRPMEPEAGFQGVLQAAQSPPIPEPPPPPQPTNSGEKEQQTIEPNAQSEKPDLSSKDQKTKDATSDKSKKTEETLTTAAANQGAIGQLSLPLPAVKPGASGMPSKTGQTTVGGIETKAPVSPECRVPLSELPTDPAAQIVSATPGITLPTSLPSGAVPTPASPGTPTAITAQSVTPLVDPNPTAPATPAAPDPTGSAAATAAPTLGDAVTSGTTVGGQNITASRSPQPVKADPESLMTAERAGQTGSGASGGGQAGSANGQAPQQQEGGQQNLDVLKQISAHSDKVALQTASENVTVHLKAPDDTDLTMTVHSVRGEVQAQFITNSESLKNALHQNRPQLAQNLESKGMNLGQVSVGLKNSSSRQDRQQSARLNQNGAPPSLASTTSKSPRSGAFSSPKEGVDIWI